MCPFHPRVTAVARKRPWSFCQNCRRQVTPKHAHTLDPKKSEWADRPYMLCRHSVGTYQRKRTTRNSSGNTRPQSPQLVETLWTDPGLTSGSSKCELIFTLKEEEEEEERKKERKDNLKMIRRTYLPQKHRKRGFKKAITTTKVYAAGAVSAVSAAETVVGSLNQFSSVNFSPLINRLVGGT